VPSLNLLSSHFQVLFTQSSAEFQHFYELLLARRLLRNRYISLSTEWHALSQLPAMTKSGLMIRDIEQTATVMHQFRSYLVDQMDFHDLRMPQSAVELALTAHRLGVNVLTANVWPSFWIRPLAYAHLTLPSGLQEIKKAFLAFYDWQHNFRESASLKKFKPIRISGSDETTVSCINGYYFPTSRMSDGWPIYEMRDSTNSIILEFSSKAELGRSRRAQTKAKTQVWPSVRVLPVRLRSC